MWEQGDDGLDVLIGHQRGCCKWERVLERGMRESPSENTLPFLKTEKKKLNKMFMNNLPRPITLRNVYIRDPLPHSVSYSTLGSTNRPTLTPS